MQSRFLCSAAVLLALAAAATAGVKVERVAAPSTQPTLYTVAARDMSSAEIIEAFRKQTGIDVIVENENNNVRPGGPVVVYDLNFKNLTKPDATKELARALAMGINRNEIGPVRLSPNNYSNDVEKRDTPGVDVATISRNQTFPQPPEGTGRAGTLNLQFRVWSGTSPLVGPCRIELTEAIDDQGRTLQTPQREGAGRFFDTIQPEQYMAGVGVALPLPSPAPKQIKTLRGRAIVQRPKTLMQVNVDSFDDAAMETEYDGGTIAIGPVTPNGTDFAMPIVFTRGTMDQPKWQLIIQRLNTLNQTAIVRGANGEVLQISTRGWNNNNDSVRMNTVISRGYPRAGGARAAATTRPATLRWDTVVETTEDAMDFDLHDLPLP